jgi:type II secretory pathway component PulF
MASFNYKVKDQNSKTLKGVVEAVTIKQATALLHDRGYIIISLKEVTASLIPYNLKSPISFSDLVHITRQLATMITAGLTLVEALSILRQQLTKPQLIKLVSKIEDEVKGGSGFAATLEKYPKVFPPIYLALVRAGEASGKLDVILARLADNLEKSSNFNNKVRGALVYPAIVIFGMGIVSVIVMTVVVPRLTSLYKEFGAELPVPTQILIALSGFFVNYWFLILILAIMGVVGFLKFRETYFGKHVLASIVLRIPVFGNLIKQATLVEVTRTLAMLIDGGVPILTSLEISQNATNNILFREAFMDASKKVEKGFPLSEPFSINSLFPPILGQMVAVGEQTGKLGDALLKLSNYFETEAEGVVRSLTTMIEPLIMVILGFGVGFLVLAVLLPIYSLTSKF